MALGIARSLGIGLNSVHWDLGLENGTALEGMGRRHDDHW